MRILVTSPRVAPGLMTLAAWDAVREAEQVPGVVAVYDTLGDDTFARLSAGVRSSGG